ncbi:MAG: DUF4136 domain-containing protein [Bacteroidota bacterium]
MKKVIIILVMGFLIDSCARQITGNYSYDSSVDFTQYKTFSWADPLNKAVGVSFNPLVNNSLVNKGIKEDIKSQMEQHGYNYIEKYGDLTVNFHTMVEHKSEVTTYPNSYYFWWRNEVRTINYKEGTLVVDVIDADTNELVWQGYTSGTLKKDDLILSSKESVLKIFMNFPFQLSGKIISEAI